MNHNIIFKAIVGSQSYGTSTPTSDIDLKGIYIQSHDDILSFKYEPQINITKDETYHEIRRFLELLQVANPTMLELLYMPEECILIKKPEFDIILQYRDKFLTKKCLESFGGYAAAQIKKANGLDKKMNWEKESMIRKTVLDFCYLILPNGGSKSFKEWLVDYNNTIFIPPIKNINTIEYERTQADFGLTAINHVKNTYNLYDLFSSNRTFYLFPTSKIFSAGIVSDSIKSNDVKLTSIPKGIEPCGILYCNIEGFSSHCKKYREYENWLQNRNINRYVDNVNHNQKVDSKNLLHCRRLLDMAMEIANEGTIKVKRPNADYLLKIKRGEVPLLEIIDQAEKDILLLNDLYKNSNLPDDINKEFVNELLLEVRHYNK